MSCNREYPVANFRQAAAAAEAAGESGAGVVTAHAQGHSHAGGVVQRQVARTLQAAEAGARQGAETERPAAAGVKRTAGERVGLARSNSPPPTLAMPENVLALASVRVPPSLLKRLPGPLMAPSISKVKPLYAREDAVAAGGGELNRPAARKRQVDGCHETAAAAAAGVEQDHVRRVAEGGIGAAGLTSPELMTTGPVNPPLLPRKKFAGSPPPLALVLPFTLRITLPVPVIARVKPMLPEVVLKAKSALLDNVILLLLLLALPESTSVPPLIVVVPGIGVVARQGFNARTRLDEITRGGAVGKHSGERAAAVIDTEREVRVAVPGIARGDRSRTGQRVNDHVGLDA